ncbi:uncharacterized protein LOC113238330 [Hyposmocoma kahamanoa]|uniref:uncharacterized protein LOC113238330 n=1 Tax=Hyposmocoma kahamanoa TaxID=1477025 RepID=UPI000E6D8AC2|nr:uncharacterized protein LOC113238330 [Hyposmocoma kahamanoa]
MPVCDLECGTLTHEFIGPVRIIVVDDDEYFTKIFKLAILMFVYVLMGMLLAVPALYYLDFTVEWQNIAHVLFGILICQCLIPIGVLSHNPSVLSTAPMRPADRMDQHIKLQAIACFFLFCTSIVARFINSSRADNRIHRVTGDVTVFFCIMTALIGALIRVWDWDCFGLKQKPLFIIGHKVLGFLTVTFCTLTYITGISTWRFTEHLPLRVQDNFKFVLTILGFIYTAVIIYFPVMKFFEEQDLKRPTRL